MPSQVEPKDYVEQNFMSPRLLQEPNKCGRAMCKLDDINLPWLTKCSLKQAVVSELRENEATLSTGEIQSFDFCIICSGVIS
jgi:hypothetical protein